jgi:hypothetical protein
MHLAASNQMSSLRGVASQPCMIKFLACVTFPAITWFFFCMRKLFFLAWSSYVSFWPSPENAYDMFMYTAYNMCMYTAYNMFMYTAYDMFMYTAYNMFMYTHMHARTHTLSHTE